MAILVMVLPDSLPAGPRPRLDRGPDFRLNRAPAARAVTGRNPTVAPTCWKV